MMQTFLLVSNNSAFIEDKINEFKKKHSIAPYAYHEISPSPSISIEQVRQLRFLLSRKPLGGKERLVLIKNIDKATIPAQNALLKMLEEPPNETYILLTTGNTQQLLATVVSRSQLIHEANNIFSHPSDISQTKQLIKKIIISPPGSRIQLSQQISKTREDTVAILDLLLSAFRQTLYQKDETIKLSPLELANCIKKTMAAKNYIEKNVNYKATLDILFLGFPKVLVHKPGMY